MYHHLGASRKKQCPGPGNRLSVPAPGAQAAMVSDRSATVRRGPSHIPHRSRPTQNSAVGRVSPRAPGRPDLLIRSMCRALMRDRPAVRRNGLNLLEHLGRRYACPRLMARGACVAEWADTGWRRDCGSPTRSREPWIGLSSASAASEAEPASEALAASEPTEAISGIPLPGLGSAATLRAAAFKSTPEESRRSRAMVEAQAAATGPRGVRSRATRPRSLGASERPPERVRHTPERAGRCGRIAGTQPAATSELETKRLSLRNHRDPGGWSGLGEP